MLTISRNQMKIKLLILVLLIVCFLCGTNNKPLSDAQKEKIKVEVKEVADRMFQGCEEANFEMANESFLDSPDFVFLINGYALSYEDAGKAVKPVFASLLSQKVTIVNEKYAIIDKTTVLYTANTKFLENFKDGHSVLNDPTVMLCVFKKIDNRWKIIYAVESYIQKSAVGIVSSKGLNQVELHKQFIGSWKCNLAKDTTVFWDIKSYGSGFESYHKNVTKGKIVLEGKLLWGYDNNLDKYFMYQMIKDVDNLSYSSWFKSNNKCAMFSYNDISNPEIASTKWEFEFKSPDLFIQTEIKNNTPVKVYTYTRVK